MYSTTNLSERGKDRAAKLVAAFGGRESHVLRTPNRYCAEPTCGFCDLNSPWLKVMVPDIPGEFVVGWRKRVIVLDWSGTDLPIAAAELFPQEDVTKEGRLIHAWSYEKLAEYVTKLLSRHFSRTYLWAGEMIVCGTASLNTLDVTAEQAEDFLRTIKRLP